MSVSQKAIDNFVARSGGIEKTAERFRVSVDELLDAFDVLVSLTPEELTLLCAHRRQRLAAARPS